MSSSSSTIQVKVNEVIILIDSREKGNVRNTIMQVDSSGNKDFRIFVCQMTVGDYMIARVVDLDECDEYLQTSSTVTDENVTLYGKPISEYLGKSIVPLKIFERKTMEDLSSSINEQSDKVGVNRWYDETSRMSIFHTQTGVKLYCLLEGFALCMIDPQTKRKHILPEYRLHSAVVRVQALGDFSVVHSVHVHDTSRHLRTFARICTESHVMPEKLIRAGSASTLQVKYKTRKRDNNTPENWYRSALIAISGVDDVQSRAIMKEFPTIRNLCRAYERGHGEKLLENCELTLGKKTSTGKHRRLGPAVSARIFKLVGAPPVVEEKNDEDSSSF